MMSDPSWWKGSLKDLPSDNWMGVLDFAVWIGGADYDKR
jgi:hypothetical protein